MKLSQNFSLAELTKSQIALRHGIDNTPPAWAVKNLRCLVEAVLQPVRDHFGAPVVVSSGFRCAAVERALKGKPATWEPNGQHPLGEAADFEVVGQSNRAVAEWIASTLIFDQLILEFHTPGDPHSGWVHCSYVRENRKEILTAERSFQGTIYHHGLKE